MPRKYGPEVRARVIILQALNLLPTDPDPGPFVQEYSTGLADNVAIEEAAAPPKTGPVLSTYDDGLVFEIFGELG